MTIEQVLCSEYRKEKNIDRRKIIFNKLIVESNSNHKKEIMSFGAYLVGDSDFEKMGDILPRALKTMSESIELCDTENKMMENPIFAGVVE